MILEINHKIEQIISSLESPYVVQDVFNKFIELYPEEWKQHKINYSKFNRSKQFGKSIPLAKPEVSLKKMIQVWITKQHK